MLLYFWVQFSLFVYFIYFVNNDAETHTTAKNISIVKWIVAVNITQIAGTEEAGTRFNYDYWARLLKLDAGNAGNQNKDHICGCLDLSFKMHWRFRAFCDFLVNGIFRCTIMGIAPIM